MDCTVNDEIFILSLDEFTKYEENIPPINVWWCLRTPTFALFEEEDDGDDLVVFVGSDNVIDLDGSYVGDKDSAIRPVLRISDPAARHLQPGSIIERYCFPWVIISTGLAIAEVPIAFRRFDKERNNYETSEIRAFLKEWINTRKGPFE